MLISFVMGLMGIEEAGLVLYVIMAQEVSGGDWLTEGELSDFWKYIMLKVLSGRCSCMEAVVAV